MATPDLLTRQYLQMVPLRSFNWNVPLTPPSPSPSSQPPCNLSNPLHVLTPALQHYILSLTSLHPLATTYPPAPTYTLQFLKHLVRLIESQQASLDASLEISERLLDLLMAYMSPKENTRREASDSCYRSYWIPLGGKGDAQGKYVTLCEEALHISQGTTGLRTWPAALHAIEYFSSNVSVVEGRQVVELGSGSGIVGIACAVLGAESVVLTDGDEGVCERLKVNVGINRVAGCEEVLKLDWENVGDGELERLGRELSLQEDARDSGAELVVVATDVVYDPVIVAPFVRVLNALLERGSRTARAAVAYISTTLRSPTTYQLFMDELQKKGLEFEEVQVARVDGMYYYEETGQISLLRVKLRTSLSCNIP
ncbi:hypothetical protein HDV05_002103 [Chytridiales sp. JEL 0842]|nr:hypothetical protein HDV05_002103 [Chytridiales sp. JEL 0842]